MLLRIQLARRKDNLIIHYVGAALKFVAIAPFVYILWGLLRYAIYEAACLAGRQLHRAYWACRRDSSHQVRRRERRNTLSVATPEVLPEPEPSGLVSR